jgi:UDP:flavonoid glycosyltransferase YjiC (YdhE family)
MFSVSAWPTHYLTMVPVGWALQAAGHEVRVLCAASQTDTVGRAGLVPVPVLDGMPIPVHNRLGYYHEAVDGRWPYPWLPPHPLTGNPMTTLADFDLAWYRRRVRPELARRAALGFDAAVRFACRWRPDLVLHDPVSAEGLLAARRTGVPAAQVLWGPIGTAEPPELRLFQEDISASFERYGLDPLHPDLVENIVDPCPASLAPPTKARRIPVRYVPYNGPGAMAEWALDRPARPRVLVTWSTALTRMSGPESYVLPRLVRTLSAPELGIELVVTATAADAAALGTAPDGVRILSGFPLHLLAPTCAVTVHHGGAGSTMTSLWAGATQLALTFATEQTANASRMAAAGAGRHLLGHTADPDTLAAEVSALVTGPGYRSRAAALRAELLDRPTPGELVATLTDLAGR